jgi:DNA-binding GntR family transcriptional regulator
VASLDSVLRDYPDVQPHELDVLEHQLHSETLRYGGNHEILTMLGRTRPILLVSKHLLGGYVELPSVDPFLEEHRAIFEFMLEGYGREAAQALQQHLRASEAKVQERLTRYRRQDMVPAPDYLRWLSEK